MITNQAIADHFVEKFGVIIGRTTIIDIISRANKYLDNNNIYAVGCKRFKDAEHVLMEKTLYICVL